MLTAKQIIDKYIAFFEERGHQRIPNASLVPDNDPTTLFTSSGMQPLISYLLGESHPQGKRLVNVQNCFRAQDFDEVGDNRHTTFFRMLGNWSLGDYFKKEQLPWFFEFLTDTTHGLGLDPQKLYVTVFAGDKKNNIPTDTESSAIWKSLFKQKDIDAKEVKLLGEETAENIGMQDGRIFYYGADKNWWSRAGSPEYMPAGEPGGPDSEVFYDFGTQHDTKYGKYCYPNCQCGRFMEIGNSVFMQYKKQPDGSFVSLPKQNVDFGGGLERLLAAVEDKQDIFETNLFKPIILSIEKVTGKIYQDYKEQMRIIADHLIAAVFIISSGIAPSNKEQGYILRRLIRRAYDNIIHLQGDNILPTYRIFESIITQYKDTDPYLVGGYKKIKGTILEEANNYRITRERAKRFIQKKYPSTSSGQVKKGGDDLMGVTEISADDAFTLYTTHGLSPTQIKSLGFTFDEQAFAQKMEDHQKLSRKGAAQKFAGGLADHQERTIFGHTATHLLHQALRDVLGNHVHQTGSNITTERIRFDFNYDKKLTDEQLKQVEGIVNEKIQANLPVHSEIMLQKEAEKLGAIGLFKDTYGGEVKIYFVGDTAKNKKDAYSIEYCGGPHVERTGKLTTFKIIKQENLGQQQKRVYAQIG